VSFPAGPDALLVLEDGTAFRGRGFGAESEAFGEAVFNTGMAGYQEVLTDPSYRRQIVTMTAPHVGNYGVNADDAESGAVQVAAFVVREASRRPSSWRLGASLPDYLAEAGTVGIEGVDTRALTLRIRERGAMRAAVSTVDLDAGSLVERARAFDPMEGADLAAQVSCERPYEADDAVGMVREADDRRTFRVAAYDFGIKRNILRVLHANGCRTTVYPATTPAAEILRSGFDGVFLSNGPGDPAATRYGIEAARTLLEAGIPVFGICLGHQLLSLALGGRTYKLRFGHRGVNQPVIDRDTGRIEITSHNHGFAVDPTAWHEVDANGQGAEAEAGAGARSGGSWPAFAGPWSEASPAQGAGPRPTAVESPQFGTVLLNRWNLNDGTLEGLRCQDVPAFGVQYHPEAAPGPHDARHLFAEFRRLMARA
jgi:carbamoyl-phosphate synthase small subunit